MSSSKLSRLAAAAGLCLGLLSAGTAQAAYTRLIAFGDSLSDSGNLANLLGVPGAPFGGRASNGPVAVEYLATYRLGVGLTNYAYSGATTGLGNVLPQVNPLANTGLLGQLAMFGAATGGQADGQALYFVMAGGNDFLSAAPGANLNAVAATAIGNLTSTVMALYGMGARTFVLPNLPNLGATVRAVQGEAVQPGTVAGATALSMGFNAALAGAYGQLAAALQGETFYLVDTFGWQTAALAQWQGNGGTINASCEANAALPSCAGYFYFDDIHPTTAAHASFANFMAAKVPEPSSWMLAGVALLAAGVSRRRATAGRQAPQSV